MRAFAPLEPPAPDPILPVKLEHRIDEGMAHGQEIFRYDYLLYRFEHGGQVITARSYRDEPNEVAIYPEDNVTEAFRADVLGYLRRRYGVVKALHGQKGYVAI